MTVALLCARHVLRDFKRRGAVSEFSCAARKNYLNEFGTWGHSVGRPCGLYRQQRGGMLMMKNIAQKDTRDTKYLLGRDRQGFSPIGCHFFSFLIWA